MSPWISGDRNRKSVDVWTLPATMVFVSVTDDPSAQKEETPPPSAALLPITVLLTTCPSDAQFLIAPPRLVEVLPVNVEFSTAKGPQERIAPPGLPKLVA